MGAQKERRVAGVSARARADVLLWGMEQAQRGRQPSEGEIHQEYVRRLREGVQPALPPGQATAAPEAAPGTVSRRGLLKVGGLLGAQVAAAFGAAKIVVASSSPPSTVPAAVQAAGGTNPVDGSDDVDATQVDQVALAALNAGHSLYAPFHGAVAKAWPGHLDRLFPPAALPAQAGRLREFALTVQETVLDLAKGVRWSGWTFNGYIPGPVIRVTEGDHVRITVVNHGQHPHSLHLHSIHPASQDGVFQVIPAGGTGTYDFIAEPFGVYPYHCHVDPLDQHVARGLYGMLIIDPPQSRPVAHEMTMVLNGYDVNFDKNNDLYSVNGMPGYYYENPIQLRVGELNRIYLVNMTEFDPVNSFHLHANMFHYIPAGTSLTPSVLTDVVHLGVADRGILEFTFKYPGQYLFHAHQNEFTIKGWSALFNVL